MHHLFLFHTHTNTQCQPLRVSRWSLWRHHRDSPYWGFQAQQGQGLCAGQSRDGSAQLSAAQHNDQSRGCSTTQWSVTWLQHNTMVSHMAAAQHNGQSHGCNTTQWSVMWWISSAICSTTQSHGGSSSITYSTGLPHAGSVNTLVHKLISCWISQ